VDEILHGPLTESRVLLRAKEVRFRAYGNETSSAILLTPGAGPSNTGVVIAHGAGNDMNAPLVSAFSEGVARAGYPVFRFNFLYREQGRKSPDREKVLAETWLGAHRFFTESSGLDIHRTIGAGKSLGGRIAARMVADGLLPLDRLVFLGYPLHPAGNPEKLRDEYLYRIRVPMLFFAGTRDPLCNLERLKGVLGRLHTDWELMTIKGGDHSFHVPKALGVEETEITRRIVEKTLEWLQG
jgi:uncharacterized protein